MDRDTRVAIIAQGVILEWLYVLVAKQLVDPTGHCQKTVETLRRNQIELPLSALGPQGDQLAQGVHEWIARFYERVADQLQGRSA